MWYSFRKYRICQLNPRLSITEPLRGSQAYEKHSKNRSTRLFQPWYPAVQHLHELGFKAAIQLPPYAIRHIQPPLLAVLVGNDQMQRLHHQLLVFLQRPGEVFIALHAYQFGDDLPLLVGQGINLFRGVREEVGVDELRIVRLAVMGGYPAL